MKVLKHAISVKTISSISNITNINYRIQQHFNVIELENKDDAVVYTYTVNENSPVETIFEFMDIIFSLYNPREAVNYNSGAILNFQKAIGIVYSCSESNYFGTFKYLKRYGEKHYPERFEISTSRFDQIVLLVELLDDEYHIIRQDLVASVLTKSNMNSEFLKKIRENILLTEYIKEKENNEWTYLHMKTPHITSITYPKK